MEGNIRTERVTDGLEGVKEWKPVCAHKRGEA